MPKLEDLYVNIHTPDMQKAVRAAIDAFADALGVGTAPREDYSGEVATSSTEARALGDLAEAWTLITEAIDVAFMAEGRGDPECNAVKWATKDHIVALQQIVGQMSARRQAWINDRLDKYRPAGTPLGSA